MITLGEMMSGPIIERGNTGGERQGDAVRYVVAAIDGVPHIALYCAGDQMSQPAYPQAVVRRKIEAWCTSDGPVVCFSTTLA